MRAFKLTLGLALVALGLLWSLQGSDLIRIESVLCVADCEPIVGGSTPWLVVGVVVMAVGLGVLVTLKRRSK